MYHRACACAPKSPSIYGWHYGVEDDSAIAGLATDLLNRALKDMTDFGGFDSIMAMNSIARFSNNTPLEGNNDDGENQDVDWNLELVLDAGDSQSIEAAKQMYREGSRDGFAKSTTATTVLPNPRKRAIANTTRSTLNKAVTDPADRKGKGRMDDNVVRSRRINPSSITEHHAPTKSRISPSKLRAGAPASRSGKDNDTERNSRAPHLSRNVVAPEVLDMTTSLRSGHRRTANASASITPPPEDMDLD